MSEKEGSEINKKQTNQLKKMMKHIQKTLKGGRDNSQGFQPLTKKLKGGSLFSYMKYYLDSVFDRENFLKKQKEEQLNGIKEPYEENLTNLTAIHPVDISPAAAFDTLTNTIQTQTAIEEAQKDLLERPEVIAANEKIKKEAEETTKNEFSEIEESKNKILDDLKKATENIINTINQHAAPAATQPIPVGEQEAIEQEDDGQNQELIDQTIPVGDQTQSSVKNSKLLKKCDLLF
jgi:hypothetical protein